MKIVILLIICSFKLYAGVAIVKKYSSFMYHSASYSSIKMKALTKGEKVFLNDKYFDKQFHDLEDSKFLESVDQNGLITYIPKNDLKLIFEDERENLYPITLQSDSSDFRPKEPLHKDFPFKSLDTYRGMFDLGYYSTGGLSKYNYPVATTKESFGIAAIVRITMLKRSNWDEHNRFFIGGNLALSSKPSAFKLASGFFATELNTTFEIGPSVSYDFYRKNENVLTLLSTINFLYHKHFIKIENSLGNFNERKFSSFGFKPGLSFLWQKIPQDSQYNFYAGFSTSLVFAHTLTADSPVITPSLWNGQNDRIVTSTSLNWSLFIGILNHF